MTLADIFSYTAAVLTTASFFPQALRVIRTRDTAAISLTMYAMFTIGVALWLGYGLITQQPAIIAANGITVTVAAVILTLKVRGVMKGRRG